MHDREKKCIISQSWRAPCCTLVTYPCNGKFCRGLSVLTDKIRHLHSLSSKKKFTDPVWNEFPLWKHRLLITTYTRVTWPVPSVRLVPYFLIHLEMIIDIVLVFVLFLKVKIGSMPWIIIVHRGSYATWPNAVCLR